ncbi:MAG TPA: FHA domain-containing protein [Pyrinomonadaceae bacterium]|nr:FHA domain-containing protein [Pyrinomonadaceae bacterium]
MTIENSLLGLNDELTALVTLARERTAGIQGKAHLPGQGRVALLVTAGPMKGSNFPINKPQILIGRATPNGFSEADVAIADPKISRKHCVVEVHGLVALLVDLDSVNGTFIGGKRIANCELVSLSEFQIGRTTLVFAIT